jgi:hydrogenase maturation protease
MQSAILPPALALWRAGHGARPAVQSGQAAERASERNGTSVSRTGVGAPALLLACGNSLRQDDGVGLQIAEAAEQLFPASRLRIIAAPQFTPEMAAELAATDLVLFVDASASDEPGAIRVRPVAPCTESAETHRLDPPALMALALQLCGHAPARAFVVTIGAQSFGYGEDLSGRVRQAVPRAVRLLGNLITAFGNSAS